MGFSLVECLAKHHGIGLSQRGLKSVYGRGKIGKQEVILAKPQTYVNLSGEAVMRLLQFFRLQPQDLLLLHDDLDLSWGKIRIRLQGGHGGHKGIKSVIEALGTNKFPRVKIGIGRPPHPHQDPADYVLEPLTGKEREELKEMTARGARAVATLLTEGPQAAMEKYHKKDGG